MHNSEFLDPELRAIPDRIEHVILSEIILVIELINIKTESPPLHSETQRTKHKVTAHIIVSHNDPSAHNKC